MQIESITGQQWLTDLEELHVVVLQVAAPTDEELLEDSSRTSVVKTIQALLSNDGHLGQIVPGQRPALLALPELALSFGDWNSVDGLVRAHMRPLILISGFGFSSGAEIRHWPEIAGQTLRRGIWEAGAPPEVGRVYNGGFVWIHRPGIDTRCYLFLKRTAEQSREIHVPHLAQGTQNLCIELDDLVIFPAICSDFLSMPNGQRMMVQEISSYLHNKNQDARKVLVVGLLLQDKPHPLWRTAITDIARVHHVKVSVLLANSSHRFVAFEENSDCWRDYSGVYSPQGRNPVLDHFANVRRFANEHIDASVVRASETMVVGGPIRWVFSQVQRHLWGNTQDFGIAQDGELCASPCSDAYRYEALRIVRRATLAPDGPASAKTPFSMAAFQAVQAQFMSLADPTAKVVCEKTVYGQWNEHDLKATGDRLSLNLPQLINGLKLVGALKKCDGITWQEGSEVIGQLKKGSAKILLWAYPGPKIDIRNKLNQWRATADQPTQILAFTKASGIAFAPPNPISDRRRDVSEAPSAESRSADEVGTKQFLVEIALDELDMCLDADNDNLIKSALLQQIEMAEKKSVSSQ